MTSKSQSITEELREAWADADHGMCLGFQRCERAVEVACVEIERLRKIAAKYELLAADGDQAPKHRFTAEAKEGCCIHCSRVMGEHSKGDLCCPETTGVEQ